MKTVAAVSAIRAAVLGSRAAAFTETRKVSVTGVTWRPFTTLVTASRYGSFGSRRPYRSTSHVHRAAPFARSRVAWIARTYQRGSRGDATVSRCSRSTTREATASLPRMAAYVFDMLSTGILKLTG